MCAFWTPINKFFQKIFENSGRDLAYWYSIICSLVAGLWTPQNKAAKAKLVLQIIYELKERK